MLAHALHALISPHAGLRVWGVRLLLLEPRPSAAVVLTWVWYGPDGGFRRAALNALTGGLHNSGWHAWYGRWWAFQMAACIGPVNLGVHLETRARRRSSDGMRYGPYLDVHLPFCIASVGVNPIYSGELDLLASCGRGGLNGDAR